MSTLCFQPIGAISRARWCATIATTEPSEMPQQAVAEARDRTDPDDDARGDRDQVHRIAEFTIEISALSRPIMP
jgi:hypothetical protein